MKTIIQKGFTLIELMITIAIIGILVAIALPAYQDYVKRTYVSEGLSLAGSAKAAVTEYYSANNTLPGSNFIAGLSASNTITGNAVKNVNISNGIVIITYNHKVEVNKKIILTPQTSFGSIQWTCSVSAIDGVNEKFLPSECR